MQADVIVVGAGISGLRTATNLVKSGLQVTVLEARDRVGGRTLGTVVDGYVWDLGGQWVGGTHKLMAQQLQELGIKTFPQVDDGKHVLDICGKLSYYSGNISSLNNTGLNGVFRTIEQLDRMADTVNPEHPEKTPNAKEWDAMTIAEWTRLNVPEPEARTVIDWFARVCLASEPSELSFLYFLWFLKAAGGYSKLADIHGGAQQERIIGGSQSMSIKLAERLGDRVKLNSPVIKIDYSKENVEVTVSGGSVYRARKVVVAVPPVLTGRIQYNPPVPPMRDELSQRMPMGTVIKTITIYDKPFWRENGYSAEAISDCGPIYICYDACSYDRKRYAIVGFIAGQPAREWAQRTQEERRKAIVECYAKWWGPQALTPLHVLEKNWKEEEYSRGCYMCFMPPGVITSCGKAIAEPIANKIFWAGSETSSYWWGYMEGALFAGDRAAKQVVDSLSSPKL